VKAFESLFTKYAIDIYFSGHLHYYERLWPVAPGGEVPAENYDNPSAPVYIINGCAGNVENHSSAPAKNLPYTALVNAKDFGYGRLVVHNASTIDWQMYRSSDQSIMDQITLVKQNH